MLSPAVAQTVSAPEKSRTRVTNISTLKAIASHTVATLALSRRATISALISSAQFVISDQQNEENPRISSPGQGNKGEHNYVAV